MNHSIRVGFHSSSFREYKNARKQIILSNIYATRGGEQTLLRWLNGIFIFYPSQKTLMQKIEKIQIAVLRSAMGYRRTTPTNVILAETKMPLIDEHTKLLCKYHF